MLLPISHYSTWTDARLVTEHNKGEETAAQDTDSGATLRDSVDGCQPEKRWESQGPVGCMAEMTDE